jgi:hypothetical protein
MIRQLLETGARGAALVVTNRRWGVTLSAAALGFGLFAGVAIGPGTPGSLATGPLRLIETPSLVADAGNAGGPAGAGARSAPLASGASEPLGEEPAPLEALPSSVPLEDEAGGPEPIGEPDPEPTSPTSGEPAETESTALRGTVVHANPAAGSYALSIEGGELVPLHARKLPVPGARLSLVARRLANGTFAEEGELKRSGVAKQASFRGVVTFVYPDPAAPAYTLSGRGVSLLVRVPADPTGIVPPLPPLGGYATAGVAVEPDGTLVQRTIEVEPGEPATYLDLAGIYAGLSPETGKLLLSADDTRRAGQDVQLTVPPTIDAARLEPGDSYLVTATVEPDGTLTLAGIVSDEHRRGADDPSSAQGDLKRGSGAG